jgi:hypothetical protein
MVGSHGKHGRHGKKSPAFVRDFRVFRVKRIDDQYRRWITGISIARRALLNFIEPKAFGIMVGSHGKHGRHGKKSPAFVRDFRVFRVKRIDDQYRRWITGISIARRALLNFQAKKLSA